MEHENPTIDEYTLTPDERAIMVVKIRKLGDGNWGYKDGILIKEKKS